MQTRFDMKKTIEEIKKILFDSGRATADHAVGLLLARPELLQGFRQLAFSNEYPFDMRSSNVIEKADEKVPGFAASLVPDIVSNLTVFINDGPRRQFLRMLVRYTPAIDEDLTGILYDACYGFACDRSQPVAVRHNAVMVLEALAMRYPELKSEIVAALELRIHEEHGPFGPWLRAFLANMNT
jgi:hypothetical protein